MTGNDISHTLHLRILPDDNFLQIWSEAYHQENNIWHLLDGNVSAYLPLNSCTRQQLINRTVVATLSLTWYLRFRRKTHFTRSGWIVKFAYRAQRYTLTESAGLFKALLTAVQNSSERYLLFMSALLLLAADREESRRFPCTTENSSHRSAALNCTTTKPSSQRLLSSLL